MITDLFADLPAPPSDGPYKRPTGAAAVSPGTARSDICAGKHGGNEQSEAANARVHPHAENLREHILRFVRMRGPTHGATTEEISEILRLRYTTVSARLSELKRDGLVVASGRTRKTSGGSDAAVLIPVLTGGNSVHVPQS